MSPEHDIIRFSYGGEVGKWDPSTGEVSGHFLAGLLADRLAEAMRRYGGTHIASVTVFNASELIPGAEILEVIAGPEDDLPEGAIA